MDLNSFQFVVFLAAVCAVGYFCPRRLRYVVLLACSYIFYLYSPYGWQEHLPALGLLLCTTTVSYVCALAIADARLARFRKLFLVFSILVTLSFLILSKYYDFFMFGLRSAGVAVPAINLVLPLGISYYTLQSISYVADVYLGNAGMERNPVRYALYVSFFPGIVTGPINRAPEMLPQYKLPPRFSYDRVAGGLFRVLWGLFKKMVVADSIGLFTFKVFSEPRLHSGPVLILGALLFAYQLYADFGGCCDIAIGAARMLGFTFAENFDRPFSAKTFTLFWQRWHMSLTSFFRDYVFTPLVWSRWCEKLPIIGRYFTKPPVTTSVLLIYTLSGLWHGASMGYVLWGIATGVLMVLAKWVAKPKERLVKKIPLYRSRCVRGVVQRIVVYCMFAGTLVFFAAALYQGGVMPWLQGLLHGWRGHTPTLFLDTLSLNGLPRVTLVLLAVCIPAVELAEKFGVKANSTMADWIRRRGWWVRWPVYYALLAIIFTFGVFGQSSFIYQQY